jgi:hypothetical protein
MGVAVISARGEGFSSVVTLPRASIHHLRGSQMVSYDESLLAHEQIYSQYRGLHTGERYPYTRGDVRNQQACVALAHLMERAFRDAEMQAAADSQPPQAAGLGVLGAMLLGANPNG